MKHSLKLCDFSLDCGAKAPGRGGIFQHGLEPAGLDSCLVVVKANGQEDPDGKRDHGMEI